MPSRSASRAENELASKLWERGYLVVRAAASGSGLRERFQPDLVAAKDGVIVIIEVKSLNRKGALYVRTEQVKGLKDLRERSGGFAFIAVRLRGGDWRFHSVDELREVSKRSYRLDDPEKGLRLRDVDELLLKKSRRISEFFQL
ncbi:MAG: Holliday junction resolvase Hjc [Acidilobaceae archaeon]